jgi:hypothetical protein
MARQNETAEWTEGVYRIPKKSPVVGFHSPQTGVDNLPFADLANRTRWLKEKIGNVGGIKWPT